MNKNIQILPLLFSISFFAFGFAEKSHATDDAHSHGHSEHAGKMMARGLSLNNGVRWEMDEHTRKMSLKMEKTFFAADHSNQASLKAMGTQLDTQLSELIKGCTMSGEAHDQLHIFLSDYIPTIKSITNAEDYETARNSAIKLKENLQAYKKHFK